ncbi:MAG TPA: sigma-70 family RNA polymerase sigma factor [Polyangiaceae bacterium]
MRKTRHQSQDVDVNDGRRDADETLMQRAARGEQSAFAELYDRHAPTLLATATRMLGAREAQDVLHDVFLEAWCHVSDYSASRGSVRTWLLVRLRSRALDRLIGVERARTDSLDVVNEAHTLAISSNLQHSAVDRIAVRTALERLGPEVREALELSYFAGLTMREIAERAGVPLGTVKSRIARGLAALSSLLNLQKEPRNDS